MACITRLMCIIVVLTALATGAGASPVVVFDDSHNERFTVDGSGPLQLSGLAAIVKGAGASVVAGREGLNDAALKGVDALVISGAFKPLAAEEIEALLRFMEGGGRLAVMLHIAPPLQGLLDRLQITNTMGPLQEKESVIGETPTNFQVTHLETHPLLKNLTSFSVYGAWGLLPLGSVGRTIAATSEGAWVDFLGDHIQRKEATGAFGVAVAGDIGKGGFVIFGDDAIFQNKFLDTHNKALAANLAAWLLKRESEARSVPTVPLQ